MVHEVGTVDRGSTAWLRRGNVADDGFNLGQVAEADHSQSWRALPVSVKETMWKYETTVF